jgi:beta-1,4-mannosyl-glycoprotein beta-1,4-N-acetylglucosaminyltransferase
MRRVVDSFMFYNELDVLKLRLAELNDVVDTFILIEATLTHSGLPKPLYFQENKALFEPYLHKIVHVVVDDLPREKDTWTWVRETGQRNLIWKSALQLTLNADDIFMWMDADEIPDSTQVAKLKENGLPGGVHCFSMDLYYYNITCKSPTPWTHAKVAEVGALGPSPDLSALRTTGGFPVLERGGWHLSYFGDAAFIRNKIRSQAHDEFNTEYYTDLDRINARMEAGTDLYDRPNVPWVHVPLASNTYLPRCINQSK